MSRFGGANLEAVCDLLYWDRFFDCVVFTSTTPCLTLNTITPWWMALTPHANKFAYTYIGEEFSSAKCSMTTFSKHDICNHSRGRMTSVHTLFEGNV